jgi:hypothetical protein
VAELPHVIVFNMFLPTTAGIAVLEFILPKADEILLLAIVQLITSPSEKGQSRGARAITLAKTVLFQLPPKQLFE